MIKTVHRIGSQFRDCLKLKCPCRGGKMCVAGWTDWVAAPIYPGKQTVTKIYRDFTGSQTAMPAKQSGEKERKVAHLE